MQVAGLFCIHAIYRKLETFLILEMAENQCGQVQNKQNNKMVIPRHSLTSYSLAVLFQKASIAFNVEAV